MAPKIQLSPELRFPADIVTEDLALILDSMGVDPRIRELYVMGIEDDKRTGGLILELLGPQGHALPVLIELIDENAQPGARIRLSLYYPEEFMSMFCGTPETSPASQSTQDVEWRLGWESSVPDVYVTVGVGAHTDPAEVEEALGLRSDERWGGIKHLAVTRLDADHLLVHVDGVSAMAEVAALIADIRSLGQPFDAAQISVGE